MTASERSICMIAHRGYSGKYHENTEQAFLMAAEHGSGGAETDIRVTKDGIYVCSHNSTAVLVDGTELEISGSTYDELVSLPLKNKRTDDEVYLCTFRRYLEIMRENNMICFVELKGGFTEEQVRGVFSMAAEEYDLSKFILQSFDTANLAESRRQYPDIPLMLTCGRGEVENGFDFCFENNISLDIDFNVVTDDIIEEFHSHGLEVALWTLNNRDDFERCKTMNVEYIESDYFGGRD